MRQIATKDEFDALLAQNSASSATTFVDFTATWCGPCCAQAGVGAIRVGESLVKQGDPAAG
jgi:hypothetical protein